MNPDLDQVFSRLDQASAPDLWSAIDTGKPRDPRQPHRRSKLVAAVVVAAVFVGAISWAAIAIRGNGSLASWRPFGDPAKTTWTIDYPSRWQVQDLGRCGKGSPITGAIFSNTSFVFRNPQGQVPGCGDRIVFAGFPRNGVAVVIQPRGNTFGLSFGRPLTTPFPIQMAQLIDTHGIVGGPSERYLGVHVGSEEPVILSTFIGPDADAQARSEVARMVGSLALPHETRWVTHDLATVGVSVRAPDDWHVSEYQGGVLITSYAAHPNAGKCPIKTTRMLGGINEGDAMLWIPPRGSGEPSPVGRPTEPYEVADALVNTRVSGCAGVVGSLTWLEFGNPVGGQPVRVDAVYGFFALHDDAAKVAPLILGSLDFTTPAPPTAASGPPPSVTPPAGLLHNGLEPILRLPGPVTAITGSGQYLYVSAPNEWGNLPWERFIRRWNTSGGRLVSGPLLPGTGLAFADGSLWATGGSPKNATTSGLPQSPWVFRLDPSTMRVTARIQTGAPPTSVVVSPDGHLWVGAGNRVLEIDPASNRIIGSVPVRGDVQLVSIDPSGHHLYVSTDAVAPHDSDLLLELDTTSRRVIASGGVGVHELLGPSSLAATDAGIWVSYPTGSQSTVAFLPRDLATQIDASSYSQAARVSVTGGALWITGNTLVCADPTSGHSRATIPTPGNSPIEGPVAGVAGGLYAASFSWLVRIVLPPPACGVPQSLVGHG
jgi:DNA-binding beta-propeller fold protein YncE